MRLIDADEIRKKAVPHTRGEHGYNADIRKWAVLVGDIDDAPTVDAVEVVHGWWECTYDKEMGETDVTCSCCKDTRTINGCYVTVNNEPCYFEDNYCPNCGARMDGYANA